jgi:FkbM family methyltransferase
LNPFTVFNRQKACRYGQMLYNLNDQYIGRSLDLYGEYSEGEVDLFRQIVKPGQIVVEVGANLGAHTVFLARHVGTKGSVKAFEPQRILFQALCANLALNSIPNVHALQQAVGATPGTIKVPSIDYTRESNFGALALGSYQTGEQVDVVTLDSYNLTACNLLKIDVEGMEKDVLQGAVNMIQRLKPILYVENDKPEKSAALIQYIDSLGYNMLWHRPCYFNPHNFFSNTTNVFLNTVSMNMLCVHKSCKQNLKKFEPVKIPLAAQPST